ncbi:hypothetical protein CCACVL1_10350 [Corchorus capsularis]|uniref:Uncharacterized protein n=1 Tax=Corchorus capsularis TaxID=210143 RepID=A0A1R3IRJ9_COCAP|nr:hypothetical protein CCACVL1_10350 [Corchorus capsularis]
MGGSGGSLFSGNGPSYGGVGKPRKGGKFGNGNGNAGGSVITCNRRRADPIATSMPENDTTMNKAKTRRREVAMNTELLEFKIWF